MIYIMIYICDTGNDKIFSQFYWSNGPDYDNKSLLAYYESKYKLVSYVVSMV